MTLAELYNLIIFDLDGVVYLGTEAVVGAPAAIRGVVQSGLPVLYATNNASRRAPEVAAVLSKLDVPARSQDVITSAQASAELLASELPAGAPVLAVGSPALAEELAAVGLHPVASAADEPVAVVQGFGPQVGWPVLAEACVAIRAGARWVATNMDATMPSPRGPVPGNGSLVAALRTALGGREPDLVVGKPEPGLFHASLRRRGSGDAARTLVVGDRLDTDIEGARRAGMPSLLVLTGVTTPADLLAAGPNQRPDHVAADLAALHAAPQASALPAWRDGEAVCRPWRVTFGGGALLLARTLGAAGDGADTGESGPVTDGVNPEDADLHDAGVHDADLHDAGVHDAVAALRALAAAAWANPQWTSVRAADDAAAAALARLNLPSTG